jgi:hypothetical protein
MTRVVLLMLVAWAVAVTMSVPAIFFGTPFSLYLEAFAICPGAFTIFVWVPVAIACTLAVLLYAFLRRSVRLPVRINAEPETYCRKCSHILRGLTEPRCPVCRERI